MNDPGILMDADTLEDYDALLQYHNQQLTRPQISLSLVQEVTFFDEKTAMLLEQYRGLSRELQQHAKELYQKYFGDVF